MKIKIENIVLNWPKKNHAGTKTIIEEIIHANIGFSIFLSNILIFNIFLMKYGAKIFPKIIDISIATDAPEIPNNGIRIILRIMFDTAAIVHIIDAYFGFPSDINVCVDM